MMRDEIERLTAKTLGQQAEHRLPAGWAPSRSYRPDGSVDVVTLGVGEPDPQDWTAEVRALGVVIPEGWACRLVEVRHDPAAWIRHGQGEDAVTTAVTRRRWAVEPARTTNPAGSADELLKAIGKRRPKPQASQPAAPLLIYPIADWQLGKTAYGAGSAQTIERIYGSLERALVRAKKHNGPILLPALGDVCEGVVSQAGGVVLTSDLTMTEQVRVYRRLLLEHVRAFAPLTDRLLVPVVPGNHDQPHRLLGATPRGDDSWAVEGAVAVADALALAGGYDNVEITVPDADELTVTVEAAGTVVGCAHGHQYRPGKAHTWLASQAHARARIGAADILLTGHYHSFRSEFEGGRAWFQIATQDPGSPWYDERHGRGDEHGSIVLTVSGGKPLDLGWV